MQTHHTAQATKIPRKKTFLLKWLVAICCLGLLFQMFFIPPKQSTVTLWGSFATHTEGERAVLQRFSQMLKKSPRSSRYVIYWQITGEHLFGVVPQMTIYDRNNKTFAHYWGDVPDSQNLIWRSNDVLAEDIHTVAVSGDFDRLRERVRRLRAKKNQ